MYPLDNISLH